MIAAVALAAAGRGVSVPTPAFVAAQGGTQLAGDAGRSLLATAFGGGASADRECWIAGADAFVRHARRKTQPAPTEKH